MFDIIIGHLNMDEYRERNLRYVIDYYTRICPNSYIIVVEQKTKTDLSMYSNVKHIVMEGFEYYSRSFSFNEGMKYSSKELNLMIDNDCILDPEIVRNVNVLMDGYVFLPYNNCIDLNEDETKYFIYKGRVYGGKIRLGFNQCFGGAMFITKSAFKYVGGYEHVIGWGVEDNIFCIKCDRLLGISRIDGNILKPRNMYHLSHPKAYDEKFINSDIYKNNLELLKKIQSMDKNQILDYISKNG